MFYYSSTEIAQQQSGATINAATSAIVVRPSIAGTVVQNDPATSSISIHPSITGAITQNNTATSALVVHPAVTGTVIQKNLSTSEILIYPSIKGLLTPQDMFVVDNEFFIQTHRRSFYVVNTRS